MKEAFDTSELARKPPKNAKVSPFDQRCAAKQADPLRWQELRIYECEACNGFHLTHTANRTPRIAAYSAIPRYTAWADVVTKASKYREERDKRG